MQVLTKDGLNTLSIDHTGLESCSVQANRRPLAVLLQVGELGPAQSNGQLFKKEHGICGKEAVR